MLPGRSTTLDAEVSFVEGNTWPGVVSIAISPAPANNVSTARFAIKEKPNSPYNKVELSSGAGEVTITDAANWEFAIPAQSLDLPASQYVWQFETTDTAGTVQTYLEGSMTVYPKYTKL